VSDPLILTLRFDPDAFERLDGLRRAYFPPERNLIPAHMTLFHALPGAHLEEVAANLRTACDATPPVALRFTGLRTLGRGVALEAEVPGLAALRKVLASHWAEWLTPQDRQGWRPHVTVQNKVTPERAKLTLAGLQAGFSPWEARGTGLLLWHYRGGPWEPAGEFPFAG